MKAQALGESRWVVLSDTWTNRQLDVETNALDAILLAMLTVSPKMENLGDCTPITPDDSLPEFSPIFNVVCSPSGSATLLARTATPIATLTDSSA
mmetsp:Transcript_26716/g.64535  ORF Transcript_26716/g.64535 Transcript_26716/m.64535 type:complete len:95 (+) Transcript_26716:248-532(+)